MRSRKGPSKTGVSVAMAPYAERRNQLLAEKGMRYFSLTVQNAYDWIAMHNCIFHETPEIPP